MNSTHKPATFTGSQEGVEKFLAGVLPGVQAQILQRNGLIEMN